ncbi:hypothetical protein B0I37DRAFT_48973 [Chaetomium sp. MPI-CAGE-AT-0009]|nr:hypothetical protein B0I37DRAFT_48973 [Chaetomium sp. MPI-CAGE-AT-0009]
MGPLVLGLGAWQGKLKSPQGFTTHIPRGRCRILVVGTGIRPRHRRTAPTPPEAGVGAYEDTGPEAQITAGNVRVSSQRGIYAKWLLYCTATTQVQAALEHNFLLASQMYPIQNAVCHENRKDRDGGGKKGEGGQHHLSSNSGNKEQPPGGSPASFPDPNQLFLLSSLTSNNSNTDNIVTSSPPLSSSLRKCRWAGGYHATSHPRTHACRLLGYLTRRVIKSEK